MERQIFKQEHNVFRESFREFLRREVVPYQEQWNTDGIVSRDLWLKAGKAGFLVPEADEKYGGAGCDDFRFAQIVCEELSNINETGFQLPLHSSIIAPYITTFGNDEQKERWMPGVVSGEIILAIAMTEPQAGSDLSGIKTSAVNKGDYWLLNGAKTFISNGILSDLVIVAANTDPENSHGISLLVVERGMEGFERGRRLKKMGMHSQDTAELFFTDVKVPKANVLGEPGKGFKCLMGMLAKERLVAACSATANARAAYKATKEYCLERRAFGQEIAKFQNTRFKLAQMKTEVDVTQAFIDRCVMDLNDGKLRADIAAEAKLWSTEMLGRVVDEGVQLHGGYGYMDEFPICRMYTDARILRILAGTSEIMKEIISRANGLA